MKKIISAVALIFALVTVLAAPVCAVRSYQTYTYSIDGHALYSPDAYTPVQTINSSYMGLAKAIDDPGDIEVDDEDNIYIADTANNRIVILDKYFKQKGEPISKFYNDEGIADQLGGPKGVYITKDKIFVADTDKNRIVLFDRDSHEFIKIIPQPESSLFDDDAVYKPIALAVDDYERLYVVSSTTYQGIIVMSIDGEFIKFVGAQKVTISAWDKLWRSFQTDAQKEMSQSYISTEFNNITMNERGFIYVTTSSISEGKVKSAITGKSKSGDYAPVKLLNQSGVEVMSRNGFWPPAGEIEISNNKADGSITGVSMIHDVAVGPEQTWSIIDTRRQKIFTYDKDGNLLFAFGDSGNQLGNLSSICGITYLSDGKMLILDNQNDNITVFQRTEYGDILINALANQNNRHYDSAINDWMEILKRNSNFDAAYIGIGDAMYRNGDYKNAMKYYESAYDTSGWSDSYKEIRQQWITKYVLLIPVIVVGLIVLITLFFKKAGKINTRAATAGGKRTFGEELLYGFHLIFHPFDGFWDLKHEKRGSVRASLVYIAVTILAFFYQDIGSGYLTNPQGHYTTIVSQAMSILVPFVLWVLANWCLTTLFEGEGSFKDIFIATAYSLLPLPMLVVPVTIYSNFAIKAELDIVSFIGTIAFIWTGLLIFVGMMVTHDYTLFKNFVTSLGTLVGMAFIMFIAILFTTLLGKIVSFITNIIVEINYRT
ncbi:MAG: YIP1 family protein [Clostridia bacterium]|nr:YIP1 family protein [Clostridia bacterium]